MKHLKNLTNTFYQGRFYAKKLDPCTISVLNRAIFVDCISRLYRSAESGYLYLAGCATASTTEKTAEATDQTTSRYLLESDRSNDQSSDR